MKNPDIKTPDKSGKAASKIGDRSNEELLSMLASKRDKNAGSPEKLAKLDKKEAKLRAFIGGGGGT